MTATVLKQPKLTPVQQAIKQAKDNPETLDLVVTNVLAHASRHWGQWDWASLLQRVRDMRDPSSDPLEMWDLQMMLLASSHPSLDPLAFHMGSPEYLRGRFHTLFNCLWQERACPQGRKHYMKLLERVLKSVRSEETCHE